MEEPALLDDQHDDEGHHPVQGEAERDRYDRAVEMLADIEAEQRPDHGGDETLDRGRRAGDMAERVHGERYPLDEEFLAALAQMPPASGVALGFDRLVMLAAGAPRIDDVLWTPLPPDT